MPEPIVCPECGEAVPAGRLACASCGALLASVVRVQGPAARGPVAEQRAHGAVTTQADEPSVLLDEDENALEATDVRAAEPRREDVAAAPVSESASPATASARRPEPSPIDAILREADVPEQPADDVPVPPRGSYLAPSTTMAVAAAGGTASIGETARPATGASSAAGTAPAAPAARRLPIARPDSWAGWLTTVGAALGLVAFLLPWPGSGDQVIGSTGGTGWFERWGLAATPNLVLILAELAVLLLGILPLGLPGWLRFGALPLVVGGVLLGVVWIYITRPFGADIGILLLGIAAVLQVAGGVWAIRRRDDLSIV